MVMCETNKGHDHIAMRKTLTRPSAIDRSPGRANRRSPTASISPSTGARMS